MKATYATVTGFRLLKASRVSLEDETTIVVGRNNSGKTSLVEVFYKFLGAEGNTFAIDDFNLDNLAKLKLSGNIWKESLAARADANDQKADELQQEALKLIPTIQLDIEFEYDELENLSPLSDFIIDLNSERCDALMSCRYQAKRPLELLNAYSDACETRDRDLVEFLRKKHASHFELAYFAVDKQNDTNMKARTAAQARTAIACDFIYAQNLFDDTSLDNGRGLSKGFEAYYRAISNLDGTIEGLEVALQKMSERLDDEYSTVFSQVFGDLKAFGVGRIPKLQELKIVSEFRAAELLRGSTRVMYEHGPGADLPEAHNGLGYSKLIYIILQFVAFFETYQKREPRSGVQLLFVEEPEAHLHPQMQAVFIKNVSEYLQSKKDWKVQLVITTHSSHVVAESGFSCLRYFEVTDGEMIVRDLNDFKQGLEATDEETLRFLRQYMELHRCDMFFADKVILIEGTAERLVLPAMIIKCAPDLIHQYVSVIEVGGAHAVKFRSLLEFLNVRTLVITDLDSVSPEGRHKKVQVATQGAITNNTTLKQWIPGVEDVSVLLEMAEEDKIQQEVRVAYQIPESQGSSCGRSFEEAFILANAGVFANPSEEFSTVRHFRDDERNRLNEVQILSQAYDIADRIDSKSDFAFDTMSLGSWVTPRYIEEGLKWLAHPNK